MTIIKMFPILGGRLLKTRRGRKNSGKGKFPILGGRLLKKDYKEVIDIFSKVSNPWREAIEEGYGRAFCCYPKKFPILGGRLLKRFSRQVTPLMSRFPILGGRLLKPIVIVVHYCTDQVSNPWREAIEELCTMSFGRL